MVSKIIDVGDGWEEAQLGDGSNTYIDKLVERCLELWGSISSNCKDQNPCLFVVTSAWEQVICGAYVSLLEGFSKVMVCSTEGRALMSMDLAAFSAGISISAIKALDNSSNPVVVPAAVYPIYGMQYVDAYVKVFYFDEKVSIYSFFLLSRRFVPDQLASLISSLNLHDFYA